MKADDILYSMKDIATLLKCSVSSARRFVKGHGIPTINLGPRSLRISKHAFEEWVKRQNPDYHEAKSR